MEVVAWCLRRGSQQAHLQLILKARREPLIIKRVMTGKTRNLNLIGCEVPIADIQQANIRLCIHQVNQGCY